MGKMNNQYLEANEAEYDKYVEAEREALRKEGAEELRQSIIDDINIELSWKTQDEGFIGGLHWVLDKLNGIHR
jgi:hypothetical protein